MLLSTERMVLYGWTGMKSASFHPREFGFGYGGIEINSRCALEWILDLIKKATDDPEWAACALTVLRPDKLPKRRKLLAWQDVMISMHRAEVRDDLENAEIVCDHGDCWLGDRKISRRTVDTLLLGIFISQSSIAGDLERYVLNSTGRDTVKHLIERNW